MMVAAFQPDQLTATSSMVPRKLRGEIVEKLDQPSITRLTHREIPRQRLPHDGLALATPLSLSVNRPLPAPLNVPLLIPLDQRGLHRGVGAGPRLLRSMPSMTFSMAQ